MRVCPVRMAQSNKNAPLVTRLVTHYKPGNRENGTCPGAVAVAISD